MFNIKELFKKGIEKIYLSFEDNKVFTDALTKVYNKNYIIYNEDKIQKFEGFVTIIDLNNFKHINDTEGHDAGDRVLKEAASYLKTLTDTVIRFGGDEFILLSESPVKAEGDLYSQGTVIKTHDMSFEKTLKIADKEMYKAKKQFYDRTGIERRGTVA